MTLFDLLFAASFLTVTAAGAVAAALAIRGKRRKSFRLIVGIATYVVVYLLAEVVVSVASPPRDFRLNERQCFDDWCFAAEHVDRHPDGERHVYTVTFRISSRARRRQQRERGVGVYLLDDRGRRYEPKSDAQAVPFSRLLQPGASYVATRQFAAPADATILGVVLTHGKFPGIFIISDDNSFLHRPSIVRFP